MTTLWDGHLATAEQLGALGLSAYGSYTFFQVRRRATHGLSLHLARLQADGRELFGAAPSEERLRELVAAAVTDDCSVRVTLVTRDTDALLAGRTVLPEVVISLSPPRESSTVPLRVRTVAYERETPWLKHRSTLGPQQQTRTARQTGFDDALFVDRRGHLSEGPTWNALFHHDGAWLWPEAAVLPGVTMQLLRQAMTEAGVTQDDRPLTAADPPRIAFALNATSPGRPLNGIDEQALTADERASHQLAELWRSITPEPW